MWSKVKAVMYERMAPKLKGRIKYHFTYCRPGKNSESCQKCHCQYCAQDKYFEIAIDKSWYMLSNNQVYTIYGPYPKEEDEKQGGLFEMGDVWDAIHLYLTEYPIEKCLEKENYLLFLFAVLDRRVGKRRIKAIYDNIDNEPEWIQPFIRLRAEAEGITGRQSISPTM